MANINDTSTTSDTSAHWSQRPPLKEPDRTKRFPDYILAGSLNLHKSQVNAAALAKHIASQWDYLRINYDGIISSKQLEINRNPGAYGGLRDGKPLTVTEWNKQQKKILIEKRKLQAEQERSVKELPPQSLAGLQSEPLRRPLRYC